MEAWQERMVTEKTGLDKKRLALRDFIGGVVFYSLGKPEQARLTNNQKKG